MLSLYQIPLKSVKAHPIRSLIMMIFSCAQVFSMLLGLLITQGLRSELNLAQERLGADILLYPTAAMSKISKTGLLMQGSPVEIYRPLSSLSRLYDYDGIDGLSRQIYIRASDSEGKQIWIAAIEPDSDFVIKPWLTEPNSMVFSNGSVAVGKNVILTESESISFFGKEWEVGATLNYTGSELDDMIFVSMETLSEMLTAARIENPSAYSSVDPETVYSVMLIRAKDKAKVESAVNWINIYVRKVTAIRSEAALTGSSAEIQNQTKITLIITAVIWFVLLAAMFIVQSILIRERKKELHVWQTIGASTQKINRLMITETLLTGCAGVILGIILTFLIYFIFIGHFLPLSQTTIANVIPITLLTVFVSLLFTVVCTATSLHRFLHQQNNHMLLTN